MQQLSRHIPVMLNEALQSLSPQDNKTYVDATFGNGGYTEAILKVANCRVIAIDRDPSVMKRVSELKEIYGNRFDFRAGSFGDLENLVSEKVDGVVFDIGVSSMQLDDDFRGFSFNKEAPLDMRMSMSGISAQELINTISEKELADLIYLYGEEKKSRIIAKKIIEFRQHKPIETTIELANIIYSVMPKKFGQIDPATRTFQAIRIAVNDELKQLELGLNATLKITTPNARIVVVDFHSLEDRIVKNFFSTHCAKKIHVSRYKDTANLGIDISMPLSFVSKVITPTESECLSNPRARSAKLRYAVTRKEQINE